MTSRTSLLAFLCFFLFSTANAQFPFVADSTYGVNGIARPLTSTGAVWMHQMYASALQADGKLLVAGTGNTQSNLEVARLNTDGSLDTSFNHTGFAFYNANGSFPWAFTGIKVAPSGKIMVGYCSQNPGNTRYSLLCLMPSGAINTAFGVAGKAEIGPSLSGNELVLTSLEVQPDGKTILVGSGPDAAFGAHKYLIARVTATGVPDSTFGINGLAKCPYLLTENRHMQLLAVRLQADGKILCAGTIPSGAAGNPDTLVLVRYNANGTQDNTYGTTGIMKLQDRIQAGAIRINNANEAYVVGRHGAALSPDTLFIRKFSATGAVASSFGAGGMATVKSVMNIWNDHEQRTYTGRFELMANGKLLVAGTSDSSMTGAYRVSRLQADGTMDDTFATNGTITIPRGKRDYCSDIQLQVDGKVVLTGYYRTGEGVFDTARVLCMRFWDRQGTGPVAGVDAPQQECTVYVYPNPVTGRELNMHYEHKGASCEATYSLISSAGREVAAGHVYMMHGNGMAAIRIADGVPAGLYVLKVGVPGGIASYKVLISR